MYILHALRVRVMGRLWDGYKKRGFYGIAITAHLLEARDLMRRDTVVG